MNAYYKLYVKSVFRLALSIVIKSSITADRMNARLAALGWAVDYDDPFSWKYYMNLAGEYHASNTLMQVVSEDTQETIDFTVENLKVHRGTRRAYTFGSRNYKDLVSRYPEQEILIGGIINPIDKTTAIESKDHNILSYDSSLVEPAEQNLIADLQRFIDLLFVRWHNSDYNLFDNYYYPLMLSGLATKFVPEILNIRKAAARTDQAHSYHLRQYLMSFSPVGLEFDYLTQKQKLYFRRNIRYLNLNLGRQEITDELTQHVLTDRGFSLAKYEYEHDYADLVKNLDPEIKLQRITLNGIAAASGSDSKTVAELLDLELPLARDNPLRWDESLKDVTWNMQNSLWNKLPTKVLESNVVDLTDAEPFTLTEILLNHWIYLSHYDYFKSVIAFTNPANGDVYRLSVKNAFIFYLYAYNKANDITLEKLPVISANRVRRIPRPTWEELRGCAPVKKVPDYYIDKIYDDQAVITPYISTEAFRAACVEIHQIMLAHRRMRYFNQDFIAEGYLHTVVDRNYMDIRIDLGETVYYDNWLKEQGIDTSAMGRLEYGLIAAEIFKTATGGDLGNTTTTRQVHAAMCRIMRELLPYSVQLIPQINDSPIKVVDGKFPILTIPQQSYYSHTFVELVLPEIIDIRAREHTVHEMKVPVPCVHMHSHVEKAALFVPVDARITLKSITTKLIPAEVVLPQMKMLEADVVDLSTFTQVGTAGYNAIAGKDLGELITDGTLSGYELLTPSRRQSMLSL